jgi:hypothetical protein
MAVHIHTMRLWCARALGLSLAILLLGWVFWPRRAYEVAQVDGRVTYAHHPFGGVIYFMPEDEHGPTAIGPVDRDGSFRLYVDGYRHQQGAVPGTYRVFVRPRSPDRFAPDVDPKYQDPRTSHLLVHVAPDWNYVRLDLQ